MPAAGKRATVVGRGQPTTRDQCKGPHGRKLAAANCQIGAATERVTMNAEVQEVELLREESGLAEVPQMEAGGDQLEELIQRAGQGLTGSQLTRVRQLVQEFADVFAAKGKALGQIAGVEHEIIVQPDVPIRQAPRRVPPHKLAEVDALIEEMEREGVIEPSSSPWASPIVLVGKKDGSTRFCIDYRKLNEVTKKDAHPLPHIDDLLTATMGSTWFSSLDLKSGYWQIPMKKEDRQKTAFCTPRGLWQFCVMPFGLCNAPATFQRAMNRLLHPLIRKGRVRVYLDDVRVDAASFEDMVAWLREVFQLFRKHGVQLNGKKCNLFQRSIAYLGYVISGQGVQTDPAKTEKIKTWPTPQTAKELHSFLQFCSYYRPFVPEFARRAGPLYKLIAAKEQFIWGAEVEAAFQDLKQALTEAPILGHAQASIPYCLDVDASERAIGAVLSQQQGGQERVLGYYSRCLRGPEKNYCVTRKELLALKDAVEHFRPYGLDSGLPVTVRTDHASLQWLQNFRQPDGQMARWLEALAPYNLKIEYRKGSAHGNADGMSRRPCLEQSCKYCARQEEKAEKARQVEVKRVKLEGDVQWDWEQGQDPDVRRVRQWLEGKTRPDWVTIAAFGAETKALWAMWDSLLLREGVVMRTWENAAGTQQVEQVLVPKQCRHLVLKTVHNLGHFGAKRMVTELRRGFFWYGMQRDVRDFGLSCRVCRETGRAGKKRAPLQQYVVGEPWDRVGLDAMGPFPVSARGNRYIVVAMDYFTKWPEAFPVPDLQAETVARGLTENVVSRFGIPRELHTDQGRTFEAEVFQEVLRILGVHKTRTTPLHPQSDGLVERFNRTLKTMLAKVTDEHQHDWDDHLAWALLAYRITTHRATGLSPAEMNFGRTLTVPADLLTGTGPSSTQPCTEYGRDLRQRLGEAHERARIVLGEAAMDAKRRYDVRAEQPRFETGDRVWLYWPQRRKGLSPKLQRPWVGPCVVKKRLSDVVFRVRTPKGKAIVVHADRLQAWTEEEEEGRVGMLPRVGP